MINLLNRGANDEGARIVALAGGDTERNRLLAERGAIPHVVEQVEDLLDLADALIITDRHGGLHREHASPFLTRGRPVYVDKPLACSVADADAIVEQARAHDAPLTSSTPLRWLPELDALERETVSELGSIHAVIASGPADPSSEYGGIFFYGIHSADVALRLAQGPIGDVHVEESGDLLIASGLVGQTHVTINLLRPNGNSYTSFHVSVIGERGIRSTALPTTGDFGGPALRGFIAMARTRQPPIPYEDLIRPIQFLEKAQVAFDRLPGRLGS